MLRSECYWFLSSSVLRINDNCAANRYKGIERYRDVLPYLDRRHQEQVEAGLVTEDDQSASYPF